MSQQENLKSPLRNYIGGPWTVVIMLLLSLAMLLWSLVRKKHKQLPSVEALNDFDTDKLLGIWYEIASRVRPMRRGCAGTILEFKPARTGKMKTTIRCHLGTLDGPEKITRETLSLSDNYEDGQLFWRKMPFAPKRAFHVVAASDDQQVVAFASPSRSRVAVFARNSQADQTALDSVLDQLEVLGFNTIDFDYTLQLRSDTE